jgi:hypothetical protein
MGMVNRALLPLLGASLWLGCQPVSFTTTQKGETTLRGDPLGALIAAFPAIGSFTNLDLSANQDFKNENVRKEQVTSVRARAVRLKILSPPTQDFQFLENLAFYARTGDTEQRVAYKADINNLALPAPNPVLVMDLDSAELQPYVTAPSMSIVVRGKGHAPPQDTRLEASVTLEVHFKLTQ